MKISISNLSEGVHAFHFSVEPALLGLGTNFTKEISVGVVLDKTSRDVLLKAEATTSGRFTCDRCIEEFDRQVTAAYQMVYVYHEQERERFAHEEVQVLSVGTTVIDISEDVRQFIMLAVPVKLLCRDDCSGLCPRCGMNWNRRTCTCAQEASDLRWSGLKKLKN